MNEDLSKLIEIINSVKAANEYDEVELIGNKESFEKLIESGFPLGNYRHQETSFLDESKIVIIPCEQRKIKVYFDGME